MSLSLPSRPAVLVPVKDFRRAKLRLSPALDPSRRAALAKAMAERVLRSAGDLPVAVVCDDEQVAQWARTLGAEVLWEPGRGLNAAVQAGFEQLARAGATQVVVAAGDLPLADNLSWIPTFEGITLVPDRRRDGTNVLAVPTGCEIEFAYGPGSFARHLAAAEVSGVPVRVVESPRLAWDVDLPADLAVLRR